MLGNRIAPIFRPMGFGMWQAAVALLAGLVAKEAVVASLSQFYTGLPSRRPGSAVASAMTGIYPPCPPSLSSYHPAICPLHRGRLRFNMEMMNSLKRDGVSPSAGSSYIAYMASMADYQVGRLFGLLA
jgi:ferrous iron transport protein B